MLSVAEAGSLFCNLLSLHFTNTDVEYMSIAFDFDSLVHIEIPLVASES